MTGLSLKLDSGWSGSGASHDWQASESVVGKGWDTSVSMVGNSVNSSNTVNSGNSSNVANVASVCDWGSVGNSLLDSDWVGDSVSLLLNNWGLDDVLDLVDWVGLWVGDWDWDLDSVWLWHVLVDNDLPLNWGWDGHWDWDLVPVDLQLRLDPGHLWGDNGVGPGWSQNLLLCDSVSWGWAKVNWGWGNGSIWSWGDWGSWDWQLLGHNLVGGWLVDQAVSGSLGDMLSSLDVLVSDLDGPGASMDLAVSNNSVLHVGLGDSWASMDGLLDVGWSGAVAYSSVSSVSDSCNWGTGNGMVSNGQASEGGGCSRAESCGKSQNQKSSHDDVCCYCYCSE